MILPIILVAALKHHQTWTARIRYLLVTGAACAATVVLTFAYYWRGPEIITDDWRLHLFTTSLPSVLRVTLLEYQTVNVVDAFASRAAFLVLAVWVGWQALVLWRDRHIRGNLEWQPYIQAALSILLFYLLVACTWFEPWYTVWPVALAALLPDGVLVRGSLVTAFAGMLKMPILDFVMAVEPGRVPPQFIVEWKITLSTLALPWAYWGYHGLARRLGTEYAPGVDRRQLDNVPYRD